MRRLVTSRLIWIYTVCECVYLGWKLVMALSWTWKRFHWSNIHLREKSIYISFATCSSECPDHCTSTQSYQDLRSSSIYLSMDSLSGQQCRRRIWRLICAIIVHIWYRDIFRALHINKQKNVTTNKSPSANLHGTSTQIQLWVQTIKTDLTMTVN